MRTAAASIVALDAAVQGILAADSAPRVRAALAGGIGHLADDVVDLLRADDEPIGAAGPLPYKQE
jgi:hypothetical protein